MKTFIKNYRGAFFVFLTILFIYLVNLPFDYQLDLENGLYRRLVPSDDVVPNTFLPYVLIKEKTFSFDGIYKTLRNFDDPTHEPYFLIPTEKGYFSAYPVLTGIMAAPIYVVPIILNKIPEMTYHENILKIALLGRVAASFYAALSVTIMFVICNKISEDKKRVLAFTIFYALGTGTFSVASRGLWMHTISQFLFSLVLLFTLAPDTFKYKYNLLGLLLGLSVINRPTGIVVGLVLSLYVVVSKRKYLMQFLTGVIPTVLLLLFYNWYFFGSITTEGYAARDAANEWRGKLTESIPAFFASPARGFIFIGPPLLLGFISMIKKIRKKDALHIFLAASYIFSMVMIGKWYHWHGSNAFGHRMLVDFLPFLAYFSFLEFRNLKKYAFIIFSLLIVYSVYAHSNAVYNRKARCSGEDNWNFYCLQWPKEKPNY